MGIFTQNQFSTKSVFLYGCNSNHCKYMKFSPKCMLVLSIYSYIFKKCLTFFELFIDQ
ncbi:hypothetical protein FWK35_00002921 [Aphis craccivora]|uniref:Uncharacterized protein n=1 Tax=Aphis craccivora TaxID=307492 RepID=A0A6G0ZK01_APHCR|nr:hypothetical protein FWK35_00002921 [Aphis craccivora]